MSLFPAYAEDTAKDAEDSKRAERACTERGAAAAGREPLESALLASDEEPPAAPAPAPAPRRLPYFQDTRRDAANLRVSTLYYPGRPEYRTRSAQEVLGARRERRRGARARRYWQAAGAAPAPAAPPPPAPAPGAAEEQWLRYVELHEEAGGAGALHAARAAAAALDSPRARAALHRARARLLPADELRAALRDDLARERRPRVRLELWLRLLEALGPAGCDAAAAAALADLAALPAAHAGLVYAHGCVLRAAGLWERLVLVVELTAAITFPPSAAFPPPPDAAAERRREDALARREAAVAGAGLPLGTAWARVERLRAAAHWRPAPAAAGACADPQRAPAAADAAELLRPARGARAAAALAVALLRLARVPLPGSERAARAAGPEPAAGEPALAESLAVLLRAARRLPPAHPARPRDAAAARAALAPLLDPPHYFSDADGFLSWTSALWEACCGWVEGARRAALACWRLRWLHALARLAPPAEARRLRAEARGVVERHAAAAPAAYAHFARLEAEARGAAAGRRAALHALRAALRDPAAPHESALFAARVLAELGGDGARHALCCAVLRRAPPDGPPAAPPPELLEAARRRCAERCAELERAFEEEAAGGAARAEEEEVCAALAPGAGEWGAARAQLAPPPERARLLARLLAQADLYRRGSGAAVQYGEQAACALTLCATGGARADAARALLPLFPGNALLALVCGGAPAWMAPAPEAGARAALAAALPPLLAGALGAEGAAAEAARAARRCARAARRGAGGALLAALRLEAEARARSHRPARALYAALDAHADHKWLYVRGAAWVGADAAALCDALLERQLRVHALLDELPHLAPPDELPHPAPPDPAPDTEPAAAS